ncbi:MAG: hypothetical protein M0005_06550 [Actinomycetota bacterium]|nr:hypothetical protein [Actinomycetota bacterium]
MKVTWGTIETSKWRRGSREKAFRTAERPISPAAWVRSGAPGDVPGSVTAWRTGAQPRAGADETTGLELDPSGPRVEALGHRTGPRGHEQLLGFD